MSSGRTWDVIETAPRPNETNHGTWIKAQDDGSVRAWFKWVNSLKQQTSSLYSFGIERVATMLAMSVGIPVPDVHLEEACGHDGLVSIAVPGNAWYHLDDETFDNVIFVDRDMWTTYMAFDIFVANSDRHYRNIFVEWNPPLRRKPVDGEQCGLWMLDYGFSGLWPVQKFDELAIAANLENLDPDADLTQKVTNSSRNVTPFQYRRAFALRGSEEREAAVRTICQITDADIDDAVAEVPALYMTDGAKTLTAAFLQSRLARLGTLVDTAFPM